MIKYIAILFAVVLNCGLSRAAEVPLGSLSPNLRGFLRSHATAYPSLTNNMDVAYKDKTIEVLYFYSDNPAMSGASHYYRGDSAVVIMVNGNQFPVDEYVSILFEVVNSRDNEINYKKILSQVKDGAIGKSEYGLKIMRLNFEATKHTKEILKNLVVSKKEKNESRQFKAFIECPDNFEDFLKYAKQKAPHKDFMKEYDEEFESLQKN